ncbi:MAG: ferritin-like domain-containing protein [Polyangiaceae bacterium]|nr:ferritin-like domain-containing protein [Polyangiaceae bacterium]
MITLDLHREVRKNPLVIEGLDAIPDEERAVALSHWRSRMASEYASARVFAGLVPQLMRAGLAHGHIARVSAMVGQELDHGLLCARVVAALGADPQEASPELVDIPAHEDASPVEAVLRNVISVGCCSETVAVALVSTERAQATAPALKEVLERILSDEAKHSRFGWRLVAELAPRLDAKMRERLTAYLVAAFEHQIAFHGAFLRWPAQTDRAVAIGAADGPLNWSIFVDTMLEVVVPGLERHGLGARRAWDAATARVGTTN